MREPDGGAQRVGVVGQDLLGRRRAAAEALAQAPVDRARARSRRAAGRRSRARARRRGRRSPSPAARGGGGPSSSSRRARTGSAARRWARAAAGALRVLGQAWPSTAPGTPVFVEYSGWSFDLGADVVHRLRDGDRRLGEARGDELELALEGRDVAAGPDAVERGLASAWSTSIAPLLSSKPQSFSGPSCGLEPELEQQRVALDLDLAALVVGVEEPTRLDRAVALRRP